MEQQSKQDRQLAIQQTTESIEQIVSECGVDTLVSLPKFAQAIRMAYGIKALRKALTDEFMTTYIMPLRGSPLGFLTDRDNKPENEQYPIHVVRDCCVEALIRGFNLVGNEFNIIADRFYGAKAGYERKVLEWPGLSNLFMQPGVPQMAAEKGALVPYVATWWLGGKQDRIECLQFKDGIDNRIPVKVNSGMGADAILGKAERKMYFRIYKRLNGGALGLVDDASEAEGNTPILAAGETAPSPVPPGAPEGRKVSLGGKNKTKGAAAPESSSGSSTPSTPPPAKSRAAAPAGTLEQQLEASLKVDLDKLQDALAIASEAWAQLDGAREVIEAWTEPQRREALTWAEGVVNNTLPMEAQVNPPAHVQVGRVPGEEG